MRLLRLAPHGFEPGGERLEEVELVAEPVVERGVGDVAAGRHIDIVQDDRPCAGAVERDGEMARMSAPANVAALFKREGDARERGDAVIALLARDRDMGKAERVQLARGEVLLDAFDLLQAEEIGLVRLDEAADEIEPEPDGVDVPGGEAEAHGGERIGARAAKSNEALGPVHTSRGMPTGEPQKKKKPRRRGNLGLLRFRIGGNL